MRQCILNLWFDMDKITNVYIESVKYGVLERHSKECDPKLVDTTVKNEWNQNWLTETDFSEHSDFLSDYIVKINKPGQAYCLYCSVPKVYGSSGKRSLRKHAKRNKFHVKFEKQIQLYQCPIQNPMEKIDHMKHVLYLMVLLLIFTNRNSALLEKLYRKNLQSAQLIESATLKRISFRLFVKTIYHFIQHLSQYNYVKMLALAIKP